MARKENWVTELDSYLSSKRGLPFVLGANDCCLFAAGAVMAITGVDHYTDFRGAYKNKAGAIKVLENYAGGGVLELMHKMATENSWPEVLPLQLSRGSVALIKQDGWDALGIVDLSGERIAVISTQGFSLLPITQASTGWNIP